MTSLKQNKTDAMFYKLCSSITAKQSCIYIKSSLLSSSLLTKLLEPFYIVTQQCCKNNALLSSVIPHAAALKRVFNHKANSTSSKSSFTTLESVAESIEEAFKKRLYSTNNSSRIYIHNNNLFLVTTAIDLRYNHKFFVVLFDI